MIDRRAFIGALAGGLALPVSRPLQSTDPRAGTRAWRSALPRKHWAWMKSEIRDEDAWRRDLAGLKAAGFDAILMTGTADSYGRHAPLVRQEGLELHAWMFTMMRGENVKVRPQWYAVSRSGVSTAVKPPYVDYYKFMCPSRADVRAYLRGVVRELASVDGLSSVHLDYIRYPDVILPVALWPKYKLVQDREYPDFDFCYCNVCRQEFERQTERDPKLIMDPTDDYAWRQYRYDTITEVVAELADVTHRAGKLLTAAVFPTPDIARRLVRQDWTKWKVDAVLPMIYNGFYKEGVPWVERATRDGVRALRGRIPLYAGLYVPDLSPADLAAATEGALAGGAHGISAFEGNMLTPEYLKAVAPILTRK